MGIEIRLPQINSDTDKGQLTQIKSYLYQLAEQLNWALSNLDVRNTDVVSMKTNGSGSGTTTGDTEDQGTFDKVKGLIIKSADIVNSYYYTIKKKLEGEYEAISDYGTFKEKTEALLTATSKALEVTFTNEQEIDANGYDIDYTMIHGADAWVKIGILEYENGFPVYGMEVGQNNKENGNVIKSAFARYTSNGVSLYDNNGNEVAWIKNRTIHITNAEITASLRLGSYSVTLADGVAFKWDGGE